MSATIENALRRLDAADPAAGAATPRSQAALMAILYADPHGDPHAGRGLAWSSRRPSSGRRGTVRLLAGSAAVAAAAAAVLALPSVTHGDRAFASWRAVPTGLSSAQAEQAASRCRHEMLSGAGADSADQLATAAPAVAERRGDWTTVVLAGAGGFAATCIADDSTHLFRDMFGSIGTPAGFPAPGPHTIEITDLGSGTARAGSLSLAAGIAGPDVVAISYHSASHGEVAATVSGGRFALWFPGTELESASRDGIDLAVTYADGHTSRERFRLG